MKGYIKKVVEEKGFGFITGHDGVSYFFHMSALQNAKMKDLRAGDEVDFEPSESAKGPRAEDITV